MIRLNSFITAAAVIAAGAALTACGSMDRGAATARANLAPTGAVAAQSPELSAEQLDGAAR